MKNKFKIILPVLFIWVFYSCSSDTDSPVDSGTDPDVNQGGGTDTGTFAELNLAEVPFTNLSEYGFFEGDISDLNPVEGLVPYDLASPLFTDYAEKSRFVFVPTGKQATYRSDYETFDFPIGTAIIKNFYYYTDARDPSLGKKIIETRLLVKKETQWSTYEYQWLDDQSDAVRKPGGVEDVPVSTILSDGRSLNFDTYDLPSEALCVQCHSNKGERSPIGPKPSNLNWVYDYEQGSMNQIEKWVDLGILSSTGLPTSIESMPSFKDETASAEQRGKAYLDANCAHCHNRDGLVAGNGIYLNYDFEGDDISKGYYKKPTTYQGSGLVYDIYPGKPEESVLVYRMKELGPGDIMAPIGRSVNDEEGIELVEDYVSGISAGSDPDSGDNDSETPIIDFFKNIFGL